MEDKQPMKIFTALPALVADVTAVGKDHTNTFHKYKYRSVDDLMAALHPLLSKHGVAVIPQYSEFQVHVLDGKECRVTLKLSLNWVASDGSSLTTTTYGEGIDNGDKATYKAMAGAIKYAILQTLMVPTEETRGKQDPESDPGTDERGGGKKQTRSRKTDGAKPAPTNGSKPPVTEAEASGDMTVEAGLMLSLISGCKDGPALLAIRQQVRDFCAGRDKGDKERQAVTDNFVSRQQAFGV